MAEQYTFKIASVCAGGEHIKMNILVDGVVKAQKVVNKSDIVDNALTVDDVLPWLIKKIVANANATTAAARKTAIESAVITL